MRTRIFRTLPSERFEFGLACRLVCFSMGWRYWVFGRGTAEDVALGLPENGFGTEAEARAFVECLGETFETAPVLAS